jgi:8-oxo-dGTP pyrophosphatase MutT (NUDIX family)
MGNPTTHPELGEHRPDTIPAATVVLVRDGAAGLETLVLRRDSRLNFAAGAWVFPGGRIDDGDFACGRPGSEPTALLDAARQAAVREAEEEAGLAVDPESLVWFSHWTPDLRTAPRFATWFFLAPAPAGTVVIDDGEIRDHQWIRPADAIARRDAGEVELVAPTWVTLHRLCAFADVEAALAALGRSEPEYFASRVGDFEGRHFIVWAGDAGYDDLELGRPGARHRLHVLDSGWVYERHD